MKVFISWSGEKSKRVAELVDEWLQCTIQSSQPWLSSRSIDRGALWFSEITAELADTTIGIICLTKDNKDKPWILFEAGALAKGLNASRVCTFLIDLEATDLENPLAQFNHTTYTKTGLHQLLNTINSLSETPLRPQILDKVFEKYWPEFESKFDAILAEEPTRTTTSKRTQGDILSEILTTMRGLDGRMVRIESNSAGTQLKSTPPPLNWNINHVSDLIQTGIPPTELVKHIRKKFNHTELQAMLLIEMANRKLNGEDSNDVGMGLTLEGLKNKTLSK